MCTKSISESKWELFSNKSKKTEKGMGKKYEAVLCGRIISIQIEQYREQTRMFQMLDKNREQSQELMVALFDYMVQSGAYQAVMTPDQFEKNWIYQYKRMIAALTFLLVYLLLTKTYWK